MNAHWRDWWRELRETGQRQRPTRQPPRPLSWVPATLSLKPHWYTSPNTHPRSHHRNSPRSPTIGSPPTPVAGTISTGVAAGPDPPASAFSSSRLIKPSFKNASSHQCHGREITSCVRAGELVPHPQSSAREQSYDMLILSDRQAALACLPHHECLLDCPITSARELENSTDRMRNARLYRTRYRTSYRVRYASH